ncbi:hypothetical protein F5Y18DRAFT_407443 [Xylariaceae sp. FL1019]|nr:hypothetical protein F5Y18DRAFT_407443 [Xylariaceae sp. FL1019]
MLMVVTCVMCYLFHIGSLLVGLTFGPRWGEEARAERPKESIPRAHSTTWIFVTAYKQTANLAPTVSSNPQRLLAEAMQCPRMLAKSEKAVLYSDAHVCWSRRQLSSACGVASGQTDEARPRKKTKAQPAARR